MTTPFSTPFHPDGEAWIRCLRRQGTPARVHNVELYLDWEVQQAITGRYGVGADLDPNDPWYGWRMQIALARFLGYDYVTCGLGGLAWPFPGQTVADTAGLQRQGGRRFIDEHDGPIRSWEDLDKFDWPDPNKGDASALEWLNQNLPDDMTLVGGLAGHFLEHLSALMGYENLCYALVEDRELVRAIADRLNGFFRDVYRTLVSFDRVKVVWGSDDLGFRTATLISPDDLREFVLPGHRMAAKIAHDSGALYLLHCCGQVDAIMDDLIDDVKVDAKHSFEDVVTPVTVAKKRWGDRVALLGGIDMDLLCRSEADAVRARVRQTLDVCQPGGGYCLGAGNTVANYIPLENYLAMLDEGRRYGA